MASKKAASGGKKKASKKAASGKKKKVVARKGERKSLKLKVEHNNEVNVEIPKDKRPPDGKESDYLVLSAIDDGEYFYEAGDFYLGTKKKVIDELLALKVIEPAGDDLDDIGDEGLSDANLEDLSDDEIRARLVNEFGYIESDLAEKNRGSLLSMLFEAVEEAV